MKPLIITIISLGLISTTSAYAEYQNQTTTPATTTMQPTSPVGQMPAQQPPTQAPATMQMQAPATMQMQAPSSQPTDQMQMQAPATQQQMQQQQMQQAPTGLSTGQTQMQSIAAKNKADGTAFLSANKTKPGVVTLPSGLQYRIINEGSGSSPTRDDTVQVHYSGTLLDGTEFDSSYKRGEPLTFKLKDVIPGWQEALHLMKAGSTWEIYIPSYLAYGELGAPPVIGPNQTLIFKVNLLEVRKE